MQPKLSLIIPVYKVEQYIERCARSIFEQSLDNIEYIVVNDCTPDKSMTIFKNVLKDYPHRIPYVKIIDMPVNSRQAAARNEGLKHVTGKYITHCDPDDWVDKNYYKFMVDKAESGHYDIVSANYIIEHTATKDAPEKHDITHPEDPYYLLKSHKYVPTFLWSYIVDSNIVRSNNITFVPNIDLMEDLIFMSKILVHANNMGHVDGIYYHYEKDNPISITRRMEEPEMLSKCILAMSLIDEYLTAHNLPPYEQNQIMRKKRDLKDIFMRKGALSKWRKTFPEVASWEYKNSSASRIYRYVYLLSHKVGIFPMWLLLTLRRRI